MTAHSTIIACNVIQYYIVSDVGFRYGAHSLIVHCIRKHKNQKDTMETPSGINVVYDRSSYLVCILTLYGSAAPGVS